MKDENLLGAPTQGLGQTVTFDTGADGAVPQLTPEVLADMQGGVRAGAVQQRIDGFQRTEVDRNSYFNTDQLLALADKANRTFGPDHEEMKQKRILSGMQRAMAGEAVVDIAASEPWYMKLFGGGADVVEGARQYSSNAQISDMMTGIESAMPELARMSQDETRDFFDKALKSAMTGDTATDVATSQAFMRQSPALMKAATKVQAKYLQERASAAQTGAWASAVSRLQAAGQNFADGIYSNEDFLALKAEHALTFQMPAGQDEEVYEKNLTQSMVNAAVRGQFHAINTMSELGVMAALSPDNQTRVQKAIESGQNKALAKARGDYSETLIQLSGDAKAGVSSPNETIARIRAVNAQVAKKTGITEPMISPKELEATGGDALEAVRRDMENRRKDAEAAAKKTNDEQAKLELRARAIDQTVGQMRLGIVPTAASSDDVAAGWEAIGKMAPTEAMATRARLFANNQIDTKFAGQNKNRLESAVAMQNPDQIEGLYQDWLQYRNVDAVMASKYYGGGEEAARMETYHQNRGGGDPGSRTLAFQRGFVDPMLKSKMTDKQRKAMREELGDITSYLPIIGDATQATGYATVGDTKVGVQSERIDMREDQKDRLGRLIERRVELWQGKAKNPTDHALKEALIDGDVSILGGYAIDHLPGQRTAEDLLVNAKVPINRVNGIFKSLMDEKLKALGAEDGTVELMRHTDQGGMPVFAGYVITKDGAVKSIALHGAEVVKRSQGQAKEELGIKTDTGDEPSAADFSGMPNHPIFKR